MSQKKVSSIANQSKNASAESGKSQKVKASSHRTEKVKNSPSQGKKLRNTFRQDKKASDDPYLNLIGKIFRTEKVQFGTKYEAWEGEVLRVNYAEGLATIITGLPEEAQKVMNLRYGLSGAEPRSVKRTGKELKIPASRVKEVERATLYELAQTHCRYFYTCSPYARDDSKVFRKTLKYLKGSGFSTFIMYILADVQICNRERLQGFVYLCPEFFSIFSNEGCEQLVKMGCEDPRDQKVLSDYLFDDFARVDILGFSPRTYEMLVFGNGIYTVGLLKMLDIDLKKI